MVIGKHRSGLILAGVFATVCVLAGSFVGIVLGGIGCAGDGSSSRLLAYCEESSGGRVSARGTLALLGPPLLTAIAGVVGVRRGRYRVVLIATVVLLPLGLLLPVLWWE
jgi:hypothetical protein